jgi:outer membrane biosynthesis protein TonB
MTPWAYRRRESMAPALAAALVLHVGLFLALVVFSRQPMMPLGASVPITIVANGPTTDSRPAVQAAMAQDAQTPTPVPEAKPPEPAPPPPPQPAPRAAPPKPAPPRPTPVPALKPTPAKPQKDTFDLAQIQADVGAHREKFSLNSLQADISREAKSHPTRPAAARQGPSRAETATEARVNAGTGVSQTDIAGLKGLLERLWNPNCSVDERVVIPVTFTVSFDGHVQGRVDAKGNESSPNPVIFAAARRAIDAVHEAAPYADVYRGEKFTLNFDSKSACQGRD